MNLDLQVEVS